MRSKCYLVLFRLDKMFCEGYEGKWMGGKRKLANVRPYGRTLMMFVCLFIYSFCFVDSFLHSPFQVPYVFFNSFFLIWRESAPKIYIAFHFIFFFIKFFFVLIFSINFFLFIKWFGTWHFFLKKMHTKIETTSSFASVFFSLYVFSLDTH